MRRFVLTAALLGSVVATPTLAQTTPAPRPAPAAGPMRDMTRAEYLAEAEARFAAQDTDRNGVLTMAEREAARPRPPAGAAMPGGGGRGGRGMGGGIAMLDSDGDGRVTRAEFDAGMRGRTPRGGTEGADMTPEQMAQRSARRFERLDTNSDGAIDAAEIEAARQRRPGNRQPS